MFSVHLLLVSVFSLACCLANAYYYPFVLPTANRRMPSCSSASKPCRVRAVLEDGGAAGLGLQEIASQPCSCPADKPCSNDWQADRRNVIVRRLRTDGNINITLGMMFCYPVQPQRLCEHGETALQLVGISYIPTEVDFINCACSDPSPLVMERKSFGRDHRQYQAYVCANHKTVCSRRYGRRDACQETDRQTHAVSYPCQCPHGTACSISAYGDTFTCRRSGFA